MLATESSTLYSRRYQVIMVAPKCPGTEVREEYKRGFGVPTLIAVHPENDPNGNGLELAKAYGPAAQLLLYPMASHPQRDIHGSHPTIQ